jgi:hypothetical protein
VLLLQQFAVLFPTLGILLGGVIGGALLVVVLSNVARSRTVSKLNARISAVESELDRMAATGEAPAAPIAPAAGSGATHLVPPSGLPTYAEPDPMLTPGSALEPGTEVTVVEIRGDWALVEAADGTGGWVNGTVLVVKGG